MIPDDALSISVFRDGSAFCAVDTFGFLNIQESDCGFGDTELEAVAALLEVMGR
jgi:hypothetical protein